MLFLHGRDLLKMMFLVAAAVTAGATSGDSNDDTHRCDTPPDTFRSVANRTCLVTGVSGMIGSYIAREVLRRGCEVHGLVRYRTHYGNLAGLLSGAMTLHKGDITDVAFVRRLISEVNVEGTLNLLEAVKDLGPSSIRIFNAGSSTVYGKTADEWRGPIPELAPLQPVSPYGVSKVAQEMLGLQYFYAHRLHVVTGRFFQQVASGGPETLAVQDFAMQIAMMELGVATRTELMHGNLETLRDMTDVRDSARAMVDLAERSAPGKVYNVCSSRAVKVRDLLSGLLRLSPIGHNITLKQDPARLRAFDEKILLGDNTKLMQETGWKPTIEFTETLKEVLDYWRREVRVRFQLI